MLQPSEIGVKMTSNKLPITGGVAEVVWMMMRQCQQNKNYKSMRITNRSQSREKAGCAFFVPSGRSISGE
jgi:hypothetical protein